MTTASAAKLIGTEKMVAVNADCSMRVRVIDHKHTWGEDRFYVQPVAGAGGTWKHVDSLMEVEDA